MAASLKTPIDAEESSTTAMRWTLPDFWIARLREKPRQQQHRQQLHPQRDGRDDPLQPPAAGGVAVGALQQEQGGDREFDRFPLEEMDRQHGGDAEQGEKAQGICEGEHGLWQNHGQQNH